MINNKVGLYQDIVSVYLSQGFHFHLFQQINTSDENENYLFHAQNFSAFNNTLLTDGIFQLSLRDNAMISCWSKRLLLEYLSMRCFDVMSKILNRKCTFYKYQLTALKCQYEYGVLLEFSSKGRKNAIHEGNSEILLYWKQLSNITSNFYGNQSMSVLNIHRKVNFVCVLLVCCKKIGRSFRKGCSMR